MKRIVVVLAAALALGACGEKEEPSGGGAVRPEPFRVILDYFPNADHAGIYAALGSGELERAGLEVEIETPPDPAAPLKLLQAGRADLVISYQPELLLARDKGADLVSVGALVQKPLTSLISLPAAKIRTPADLEGKRVGTAGIPYQSAYLRTILETAGVDPATVDEINVGFNLTPAMLSERVDATLGSFWNYEGVDLQRRGRRPQIARVEQLGVPTYNELIFVARRQDLDEDGASRVRRFLQAVARGHEVLRDDPQTALDALLEANDELEPGLQRAVIRATLPVFFPEDGERPFGLQDRDAWIAYGRWMADNELIDQPADAARAFTNEFLPGEGLDPDVAEAP